MRRLILTAVVAVLASFGAAAAWAQHGHGGGGGGDRGHGSVQACEAEFEAVVRDGRGFGMAFTADQTGYPGPLHVLELKERLGLSPEQEAKARALMQVMFQESRPKGAQLLEAEARLMSAMRTRAGAAPLRKKRAKPKGGVRNELWRVRVATRCSPATGAPPPQSRRTAAELRSAPPAPDPDPHAGSRAPGCCGTRPALSAARAATGR